MQHSSDSSLDAQSASTPGKFSGFFIPLATGVLVWLLTLIIIGAVAGRESEGDLFLAISMYWLQAAGVGGLALAIVGFLKLKKGHSTRQDVRFAVFAYVIPILVAWACVIGFSRVQPNSHLELQILMGFLLIIFYLAGLVIAFLLRKRVRTEPFTGFIAPPILGILLVMSFTAYTYLTSDEYVYRDAFGFETKSAQMQDGTFTATGVFELKKAGNYVYDAPCFFYDINPDASPEPGTITWEGEAPQAPGEYNVVIVWEDVPDLSRLVSSEFMDVDSVFSLMVSRENNDGPRPVALRHFPIALDQSLLRNQANGVESTD